MATRAAINILGDGSIIDITSLGKSDITIDHPGPGQYLVHGTLGMAPPPEGWGYVINQLDAGASVAMSFVDGVLAVSVEKEGEPADLLHSITLHVSVEDLPPPEIPEPVPPTPEDELLEVQAETSRRRAAADAAIVPLQDAVDLDEATEAELALLKEWKRYRVLLNRLQDQPGYPTEIDWPAPPA
ncbi:tail fiber assembly protein [Pseudomonas sp. zfem002]|uniref:tail fiber assembly protein n=1 Tax=Pseudomonas sp. zfem002 TaxID=3078197 RepID=UPI002928B8BE|nr:tail fiber assembly protein [Pseudomonas sp. zfem002]MDU9394302.1 tail fiber assembly protein [Pseudomonas sp. zfem002]